MRVVFLIFWSALIWNSCGSARADALKYPKRMVNGQTIDLTPLFRWSAKPESDRPLTSWVHITGAVVGSNTYGWIIEAQIAPPASQGSSAARKHPQGAPHEILLRNPPMSDRADFDALLAQHKALTATHDDISSEVE